MAEYMKATEEGNVPMTAFEVADLIATRERIQADKIERNVLRTREAAKQYIDRYITEVGLALLSAGVAANRPKAKAVARWCKVIDTESFKREEACRLGRLAATPAMRWLQSVTASNSASLDITAFDSAKYSDYMVVLSGMDLGTTNADLLLQMTIGGTNRTSAYYYHTNVSNHTAATYAGLNGSSVS